MEFVTTLFIVIMILIFLTSINHYSTKNEPMNYILRSLYHANLTHLAVNLFSFYNLSFIETVIGRKQFIIAVIFIWIISSLLLYLIHWVIPSRKVYTVGFSGVIFGLIVLYYYIMNISQANILTHLILGILPQLYNVGISFEGHLSGIIAGIIYINIMPSIQKIV